MKNILTICIALLALSQAGYAQNGYFDYPAARKQHLYYEDFSSAQNLSTWQAGNTKSASCNVISGNLEIWSTSETSAAATTVSIDIDQSQDFEIETRVKFMYGVDKNAIYLIFGKDPEAWNRLSIGFSDNQQYIIIKSVGNKFENITPWTESKLVYKNNYNILTVRKVANKYYFFINQNLVYTNTYIPLLGNKTGFQVPQKTRAKVDWLRVSYIKKEVFNYPPEIAITEPDVSRGFQTVKQQFIKVSGRATDSDGIREVRVNGIVATLQTGGYFTANAPLAVGSNNLVVTATDTKMKSTTKTMKVVRQNAPVVPPTSVKRVALIFGNSNYTGQANLGQNPLNDARDMATALRQLGFEVMLKLDADLSVMNDAIREFGRQNRDADVALFFFAGHGMQVDKTNYLLPVGINIQDKHDVSFESVSVSTVQKIMETSNGDRLNLIVLDACRNNPFRSWQRGGDSGLADMTPPSGTLIAFATSPGATASNGAGRNGLYTGELIKQLGVAQRIEDVFINTRVEVEKKSGGQQSPWELARLRGKYFLVR